MPHFFLNEINKLNADFDKITKSENMPEYIKIKAEIKAAAAVVGNVAKSDFSGATLSAAFSETIFSAGSIFQQTMTRKNSQESRLQQKKSNQILKFLS